MRKRLNIRLVVILLLCVLTPLGAVGGTWYWMTHYHRDFAKAGDVAAAAGKWDEAVRDYGRAAKLGHGNVDLFLKLATAQEHRAPYDPGAVAREEAALHDALLVDPSNREAARRLAELLWSWVDFEPAPGLIQRLRDAADRYAQLSPSDARARMMVQSAALLQLESRAVGTGLSLDQVIQNLSDALHADSGNPDIARALARAYLFEAATAAHDKKPAEAQALAAQAVGVFDTAIKSRPEDPVLLWRGFEAMIRASAYDPAGATALQDRAAQIIKHAAALAHPQDASYAQITTAYAVSLAASRQPDAAEKTLRDLIAQKLDDGHGQLQLGSLLSRRPDQRKAAIAILTPPITSGKDLGVIALRDQSLDMQRRYQLIFVRIDDAAGRTDGPERQKRLAEIDQVFAELSKLTTGEPLELLRARGAIETLKGDRVTAMATLRRALTLMEHSGVKNFNLMIQAAELNRIEGQGGTAEGLYQQIVDADPKLPLPRYALAELYLAENDPAKASAQLDAVEAIAPDSPELARLRIAQLAAQRRIGDAKGYYAKLPETERSQRLIKARLAAQLGLHEEARRLLAPLHDQDADDVTVATLLAVAQMRGGQTTDARELIKQQLARHPDDPRLLVVQMQLEGSGEIDQARLDEQLLASTDEFNRNVIQGQLLLGRHDAAGARAALQKADQLRPGQARVHMLLFQLDLLEGRLDLAEAEMPLLAKLNADESDGRICAVRLAMAKNQPTQALAAARDLVAARPDFAESYTLLGQALAQNNQWRDAADQFTNALERQHNNVGALRGLIGARLQLNDVQKAAETIQDALRLFPSSPLFREMALDFDLRFSGHPQAVVEARRRMLAASPDDPVAYRKLAQAAVITAQALQPTDEAACKPYLAEARTTLEKSTSRWPADLEAVVLLAQLDQVDGKRAEGAALLGKLIEQPQWSQRPEGYAALGDYLERQGDRSAAISALESAYARSNKSVELELRLSGAQMTAGQNDKALALLQDNASDPRVIHQRLALLMNGGHLNEAESGLKEAIARTTPPSIDLQNMLTTLYLAQHRFADGRQSARDAIAIAPSDPSALLQQANVELQSAEADLDLALRNAAQLKTLNPKDDTSRFLLADIYQRTGKAEDAINVLEEGLRLSPQDKALRLRLLQQYLAARPPRYSAYDRTVQQAELDPVLKNDPTWLQQDYRGLMARRQYDAAGAKVDQALQLAPDDPMLRSDKLNLLLESGQNQLVIQTADTWIAAGRQESWIYLARGRALAASDPLAAMKDLDQSLALAPDAGAAGRTLDAVVTVGGLPAAIQRAETRPKDLEWRLIALDLYERGGQNQKVIEAASAIAKDFPDAAPVQQSKRLRALAVAEESIGSWQEARQAYEQLLQLEPNNPVALNNLANIFADNLHRPQDALAYSQRAYDLTRQDPRLADSVADTHGWVLTLCGGRSSQPGLDILLRVVKEKSDFAEARYHLGEAYLRSAMYSEARQQLEAAQATLADQEQRHQQVSVDLKAAVQSALEKARQGAEGKADAK